MPKVKSTQLTLEIFREFLMPEIEAVIDNKLDTKLEEKLKPIHNDVIEFKDEVLGEIQKLRDEVAVVNHQYERTNKRVDVIDNHLNIHTSDLA